MIFYLSYYYKKNYSIISKNIFIDLQDLLCNSIIYKYGDFIFKNNFKIYNFCEIEIIEISYYLIYKLGNKYYSDYNRINLMKNMCDKCCINYNLNKDYIEIYLLTEKI